MSITPGTYLQKRRIAAGLSVREVSIALSVGVRRLWPHHAEGGLAGLEADAWLPNNAFLTALREIFPFSREVYDRLLDRHLGSPDLPDPLLCRSCACSFFDPCLDPFGSACAWVTNDLCSSCAAAAPDPAQGGDPLMPAPGAAA